MLEKVKPHCTQFLALLLEQRIVTIPLVSLQRDVGTAGFSKAHPDSGICRLPKTMILHASKTALPEKIIIIKVSSTEP